MPMKSLGTALVPKYGNHYPIVTKTISHGFISFMALFVKEVADMKAKIGIEYTFDTSNTENILGIKFIDWNKTMDDMALSMIDLGNVPDNRGKVLSKGCF